MVGIFPRRRVSLENSSCMFSVNNGKSRISMSLSLQKSVSMRRSYRLEKKFKINDIKVHKSRTFFTPSVCDFDNLYFVELIFFFFFFFFFSKMTVLNNFIFSTLRTLKSIKKYFVSTMNYALSNYCSHRIK